MKETIIEAIDSHERELTDLAKKIWTNPEMGWHETNVPIFKPYFA